MRHGDKEKAKEVSIAKMVCVLYPFVMIALLTVNGKGHNSRLI